MPSKPFVFTVVSDSTPGWTRLEESAHKQGIDLKTFFLGETGHTGFLKKKHRYIAETLRIHQPEFFIFVDGWDTLFVRPMRPTMPKGLWFGGEKNCYPMKELEAFYAVAPSSLGMFPFLNSGVIWGETEAYLKHVPPVGIHDQLAWTIKYLGGIEDIHIDGWAEVALNLHSVPNEDLRRLPGGGVQHIPSNGTPLVVHGNGNWPIPQWMGV